MRSLSRITVVSLSCLFSAIGTISGSDLASGAPSGAQLELTGISPAAGLLAGGNEVTIRVNDAPAVMSVDFGAATSTQISSVSAHLLDVVAPAHDAGNVDVVLHSASATSPVTPVGRYQFVAAPAPLQLEVSQRLGSPLGVGLLDAIGCTVHGFCAVEMRNRTGQVTALATFGNGHRPRIQPLPDKPLLGHLGQVFFPSIACGTPQFCVVGDGRYVRVWNGHRWGSPKRFDRRGDKVISCAPRTTLCILGDQHDTLVHDRHGWRTVPFPHKFPYPTSLSCASAHFCLARSYGPTVRFDGTSWHFVHTGPRISSEVGCASAHYCLAVGLNHAAVFDGTGWHASAHPPVRAGVRAVSCVAVGRCTAVTRFAAETFSGGRWTTSKAPLRIKAFSCVPHGICRAPLDNGQTLRFEHRRWTHTENITAYHDVLTDVSCASSTWCMAVGRSGEAFRYADGVWSREGHVDGRHRLAAISCTPDRACVAIDQSIGTKQTGVFSGGRAVRYADGRWRHPVVIDTEHRLTDVSCASADHCVAVDIDGRAITYRHGTWSAPKQVTRPPHPLIWSIDCPTIHYCATAGDASYEQADGAWRKIGLYYTFGVDCVDPSYCVFGNDLLGIEIRNQGVFGSVHVQCCIGAQTASCASRSYCAVVWDGYDARPRRTYLFNGAANRWDKRLARTGRPGPPLGIACFTGPVCIGVTDARGFVGT